MTELIKGIEGEEAASSSRIKENVIFNAPYKLSSADERVSFIGTVYYPGDDGANSICVEGGVGYFTGESLRNDDVRANLKLENVEGKLIARFAQYPNSLYPVITVSLDLEDGQVTFELMNPEDDDVSLQNYEEIEDGEVYAKIDLGQKIFLRSPDGNVQFKGEARVFVADRLSVGLFGQLISVCDGETRVETVNEVNVLIPGLYGENMSVFKNDAGDFLISIAMQEGSSTAEVGITAFNNESLDIAEIMRKVAEGSAELDAITAVEVLPEEEGEVDGKKFIPNVPGCDQRKIEAIVPSEGAFNLCSPDGEVLFTDGEIGFERKGDCFVGMYGGAIKVVKEGVLQYETTIMCLSGKLIYRPELGKYVGEYKMDRTWYCSYEFQISLRYDENSDEYSMKIECVEP